MTDQTPERGLPRTWRPRRARAVLFVLASATLATMVVLAAILPGNWTGADRLGIVLFGGACATGMWFLSRPRITATAERLTVVNIVRTWVLTWPEIIDVHMPDGEPWPTLDLADGTAIVAMGIQRSDGPRAETDLADLVAMVHERGEAEEPDAG